MKIWQNLRSVFSTSDLDREIIENELRKDNFRRAVYILLGSVTINVFLISVFNYNLHHGSGTEMKWREGIISLHLILLGLNVTLAALALFFYYRRTANKIAANILIPGLFFLVPLWGAVSVSSGQWVIPSFMAFFLICAACSAGFILRPAKALLLFSFAYVVFYVSISIIHNHTGLLLAQRLNGLYVAAVCFGISVLFWRNHVVFFRRTRKLLLQKKKLEEDYNSLAATAEQLSAANATKDKFFSIIAHDLRGPINSTVSLSELLIDSNQPDTEEERAQMLKMLHDSLTSTKKLLSNLLMWARTQTCEIDIQKVRVSLKQHVQENIDLLHSLASVKNISLNNCMEEDMHVFADPEMLNTILRNLISNAIKFTNENGVINLKTENRTTDNNQQFIEVCVRDNGVGMDAAKIETLFRKDIIVTTYGTNHETGTGFGLILCKEFIEKHDGKIWVESQPGHGSCFAFTLPKA